MEFDILNIRILMIISVLISPMSGINDTNTTYLESANTEVVLESMTTTITPKKRSKNITLKQTYFSWEVETKRIFGINIPSNDTNVLVSRTGFTNLVKKLGLKKMSGKAACYSADEMLRWYINEFDSGLTKEQYQDVCPTLLLQIHSRTCRSVNKVVKVDRGKIAGKSFLKVWFYSIGAVIACSLVGLVAVWLIPILPKSYYNSISQLLIALAVGSLTGDALLHLIPHALMDDGSGGHSHGKGAEKTHRLMVWKALVAFIGIHLFFLTERITILCQNLKSKQKLKHKQSSYDNVYLDVPSGDTFEDPEKLGVKFADNKSASTGKLHWASKSRKYSSSSRDLEHASSHNGLNNDANIGAHLCNRPKTKPHVNSDCPDSMNIEFCHTINPFSMTEVTCDSQRSGNNVDSGALKKNVEVRPGDNQGVNDARTHDNGPEHIANNDGLGMESKEHFKSKKENERLMGHISPDSNCNNIETKHATTPRQSETKVEIGAGGATVKSSVAHPFHNKPHGHHHGHSHDLSSVKAIAYTVIAGDGLHNFCDGIAIGAAFANDLSGGLSTAIAVLCHELPHELGDFVVLLHAGMSFRTAIFYNLMSSIFCAAGMIIGVLLGAIPSISSWIFMLTAGMFLYIALVDMMPELSTRRLQGNKLFHRPSILFLWQNIGLLLGVAIMLLIALYEEHMF